MEDELRFSAPDYVVLVVADVSASLDFYTGILGLTLAHRSGPFAQLDTGSTRLALYQRESMAETLGFPIGPPMPERPAFELGFKVTDVDRAYETLVGRGAEAVTPPTTRAWGQRTAYLADPDGHLIELAQDVR